MKFSSSVLWNGTLRGGKSGKLNYPTISHDRVYMPRVLIQFQPTDIPYHLWWRNFSEGKALAVARDCKFIETSSGIQHNVDELLVGILKQIRLRESRDKKKSGLKKESQKLHGSKTSLSLNIAREILQKICMNDISKSKSCENLHVL